jgi:hypothetical protein
MKNQPRDYAPMDRIPEWVIDDLRWYAEVLANGGNPAASRKLLAQIKRGTGISRTLLKTAWDNTFTGDAGPNPPDRETRNEFGRIMVNMDELARPEYNLAYLLRPGYDEPRGPGRPLTADEPRDATVQVRITVAERDAIDEVRGTKTRSDWIRQAILNRLEESK